MKNKILKVLCFVLFIILGILVKNDLTSNFDSLVYNCIIYFKSDTLTNIFKVLTYMGSTPFIMTLNIIVLLIILKVKNDKLYMIPLNSLLSVIFNNIFKQIFRRARPSTLMLIHESGYSYPSGHTMISVLFYGTIFMLINKSNIKYKRIINIVLVTIILLICISRVYLGVHYITDIIGGCLLALSIMVTIKENK